MSQAVRASNGPYVAPGVVSRFIFALGIGILLYGFQMNIPYCTVKEAGETRYFSLLRYIPQNFEDYGMSYGISPDRVLNYKGPTAVLCFMRRRTPFTLL